MIAFLSPLALACTQLNQYTKLLLAVYDETKEKSREAQEAAAALTVERDQLQASNASLTSER